MNLLGIPAQKKQKKHKTEKKTHSFWVGVTFLGRFSLEPQKTYQNNEKNLGVYVAVFP